MAIAVACGGSVVGLEGVAHADGVAPAAASAIEREQAQNHFVRAKELFDAATYDKALEEFRASLAIVNSPNTRLYVARCLRSLGDVLGAYTELGRTALEAREAANGDGRYALTADEATKERDDLAPKIGFVKLDVRRTGPDTVVKIAGASVPRAGWGDPVPVAPGKVDVVAENPGAAPITQTIDVAAGGAPSVAIIDAPGPPRIVASAPQPASPRADGERSSGSALRPLAFVAAGIGVVGLGVFTVEGLHAKSTYDDLKAACGSGPCPSSRQSDIDGGSHAQTIANVGLVVGVVGVVAGATLFVVSASQKKSVRGGLVVGPGSVALRGTFGGPI